MQNNERTVTANLTAEPFRAKASLSVHQRQVVTTVEEQTVTLEMTQEEAGVLLTILNRVGGFPDRSHRGHAQKVLRALEKVVVPIGEQFACTANPCGIYFNPHR